MSTEAEIEANKKASFAKRIAGRFAHYKFPKLIVLKDKHEDSYYLVNDVEAVWRWALQVLEMRIEQQYIREPTPPKPVEEVPDDLIEKLPESLKKKALADKRDNAALMKRHQKYLDIWNDCQRALAERNGALAFRVLDDRKDAEYEGFTFENVKIP
jgi:hypothetical protein